jgi:hypothetical protein
LRFLDVEEVMTAPRCYPLSKDFAPLVIAHYYFPLRD